MSVLEYVILSLKESELPTILGLCFNTSENFELYTSANTLTYSISELYILWVICVLLVIGLLGANNRYLFYPKMLNYVTNLSIYVNIGLIILFLDEVKVTIINNIAIENIYKITNISLLTLYCKLFIIILFLIILWVSKLYYQFANIYSFEYVILLWISLLGVFIFISTDNILTLYLSLELQSLSFFILAAIKYKSNFSTEAALKYYLLTSIASGFLLFGLLFLYLTTGNLNLIQIYEWLNNETSFLWLEKSFILGLIFFNIGFFFKMALVPFHNWIADVYEGIPTAFTSFLATIPKVGILVVLLKINFLFNYQYYNLWLIIFSNLIIISIFIGSVSAIYESRLKRIMAYSTILSSSYIMLGLYVFNAEGFYLSVLFIMFYFLGSLGIFLFIMNIRLVANNKKVEYLEDLISFFFANPILSLLFVFLLFAVAAIPPFIGFLTKFFLLSSLASKGYYFFIFIILIISLISYYFYFRIIRMIFFDYLNNNYYWNLFHRVPKSLVYSLIFIIYILFLMLFFVNLFLLNMELCNL